MAAYYNEIDPYAAQWLRNLIAAGHIAPGDVDERSIVDVRADDLRGYRQCHFFAGIGGWAEAFRLAGWKGEAWTGSCPCQPLSSAGQQKGHADERHLWPAFQRLIAERRPPVVFGEQVASALGREWLAGVRADLEALGYACGSADLCAACVGAPEIRQRLYWLADADLTRQYERPSSRQQPFCNKLREGHEGVDLAGSVGRQRRESASVGGVRDGENTGWPESEYGAVGAEPRGVEGLGNTEGQGLQGQWSEYRPSGDRHSGLVGLAVQVGVPEWNGPTVAIVCSDGPRRVSAESESFPLAHGVSGRMGRLRAYGNAIIPQVAAEFIQAYMQITQSPSYVERQSGPEGKP